MRAPAWPIGNEYLSFPDLDPRTGDVPDVFTMSERASGLLGLRGGDRPLLRIVCADVDGTLHPFAVREASREDAWTPLLNGAAGGRDITVRFIAPPSERAMIVSITAAAAGAFGVTWSCEGVSVVTGERRELRADLVVRGAEEDGVVSGEALAPLPLLGWAIAVDGEAPRWIADPDGDARRGALVQSVPAGATVSFFVAVAADGSGARRTAAALRAVGAATLDAETRRWLQARAVRLRDPAAEARANLNLFFNRFFAAGRTLERGRLVAVTSRSPGHPGCGIFRARDALLWSLPGLCVQEPAWAGEFLLDVYDASWPQGADHGLYLHGAPMFPADDLVSLCAYPVAYETAHDLGVDVYDDDDIVIEMMENFPLMLQRRLDEAIGLYPTGRSASARRFDTYHNVLAWRALEICASWQERMNRNGEETYDARTKSMAGALRWAIRRHCLAPSAKGASYAVAVTDGGDVLHTDDPNASILLLPHYGFCRATDAAWRNAVRATVATRSPQWVAGKFGGPAAPGARGPSVAAACNQVLAGAGEDAVAYLVGAPLDAGIACDEVDARTGRVAAGGGNAALAGFLGYVLWTALREEDAAETPPER